MPSVLSTLGSSNSCYESLHPWTPNCSAAGLDLLSVVFLKCLKLYGPLSLVQHIIDNRSITTGFTELAKDTVSSATFVSSQVYLSFTFICLLRYFTGSVNLFTIYSSVVAGTLCVIPIGSQSKINTITILLVKAAAEAFYKSKINYNESSAAIESSSNGQNGFSILVFSSCLSISLYLTKKYGYKKDPLSKLLKLLFGTSEEAKSDEEMATDIVCTHDSSCFFYILTGFIKPFILGYSWMTVLEISRHPFRAIKNNLSILMEQKSVKFALFLGTMASSYRFIMCLLRKKDGKDDPNNSLTAGFISGLSLTIFPSTQLTLFMFWKTLFSVYWMLVKTSNWKYSKVLVNALFSLSSATVILMYLTKPDSLPKSYVKACDKVLPTKYINEKTISTILN